MSNLRALAEADLAETLEDSDAGFGLPVELIDPDGVVYSDLVGQVLYDSTQTTESGVPVVVHKPVVTLRRSSLTRVPLPAERGRWVCKIPLTPDPDAETVTYIVDEPLESGGSIGFVRLYLTRAEQSS
jgi:hypothetical protein